MTGGVKYSVRDVEKKRLRSFRKSFVFREDSSALQVIIPLKEINIDLQPVAVLSLTQPLPLSRLNMKGKKENSCSEK